jgi:hypothetical protein
VLRAGAAVEADDVNAERFERHQRGGDIGAQEHTAGSVERDLRLNGDTAAFCLHRAAHTQDRRFQFEDILCRLDDEEIDAALQQPTSLFVKDIDQLVKGDIAQRWSD